MDSPNFQGLARSTASLAATVIAVVAICSCDLSLDFGQPSTRALEDGAASSIGRDRSFELVGALVDSGTGWKVDVQVDRSGAQHITAGGSGVTLEAIVKGGSSYFRGREFLARHLGTDPGSLGLVSAAGDSWWKGAPAAPPNLSTFVDGHRLRAAFLGPVITARQDHVSVEGVSAVELSGPRADVYVAEAEPHHLLRVATRGSATIDGMTRLDLHYRNFEQIPSITPPATVIDFADLSTLAPIYTVVSVDTTGCQSPCYVAALLRNLGGRKGAKSPSTVAFAISDAASGRVLGSCLAPVQPDVDYNQTTTVGCNLRGLGSGQDYNSAVVTAIPDNPGRS